MAWRVVRKQLFLCRSVKKSRACTGRRVIEHLKKEKVRFRYDTYSSLVTNLIAGNDEYNQEERLDKMIIEYKKIGNKYFELADKYYKTPNQYYLNWLKEDINELEGIKGHL